MRFSKIAKLFASIFIIAASTSAHATVVLDSPRPIVMTWTDNSNDETGFRLERNLNGGAFAVLALGSLGSNITSFSDGTVAQSTTVDNVYGYRVVAFNAAGSSAPSNVDYATIKKFVPPVVIPSAPSGFTTSAIDADTLESSWQRAANASQTELRRLSSATGAVEKTVALAASAVSYRDNGVPRRTTKCYEARHLFGAEASAWSDRSCATTR